MSLGKSPSFKKNEPNSVSLPKASEEAKNQIFSIFPHLELAESRLPDVRRK
jgi:hypothetical protein